jgi:hypothetical protein
VEVVNRLLLLLVQTLVDQESRLTKRLQDLDQVKFFNYFFSPIFCSLSLSLDLGCRGWLSFAAANILQAASEGPIEAAIVHENLE